jgi:phage terminase large subunit
MNWRDNPWFPEVLEKERRYLEQTDPEEYANIWEGQPRTSVAGAIYAKEMAAAVEEERIRSVPYDPKLMTATIWDLGWNDQTAIIFAQRVVSEVRIIDYEEDSFLRPDQWAKRLLAKPYLYSNHWLPHDGDYELQASGGQSMRKILKPMLGREPKITPKPKSVEVPIKAARMMFPRVYIDRDKCARLLECLKRFRRGVPESTGEPGAPVKDEFRHGADAFGYLAMIVDQLGNEEAKPKEKIYMPTGAGAWMS